MVVHTYTPYTDTGVDPDLPLTGFESSGQVLTSEGCFHFHEDIFSLYDPRFFPALEYLDLTWHTMLRGTMCFEKPKYDRHKGQLLYLRRLSGITPGDSDAGTVSVSVTGVVAVVVSSRELLIKEVVLDADGLVVTGVCACWVWSLSSAC